MSNLQSCYNEFLALLRQLEPKDYFLNQRKKPKFSDKELTALSLASETVSVDSESNLFNQLPVDVEGRIENLVCNRCRCNPSSVHGIHHLETVKNEFHDCVLIGDKGYLSHAWQLDLFEHAKITLTTPHRNNQKQKKHFPYFFKKARKRIEILFSQLCDQFMIEETMLNPFKDSVLV